MSTLYRLLFRLLSRHSERIDRVLFWLYVRLLDEKEFEAWEVPPEPPQENVVHLPRRGLH